MFTQDDWLNRVNAPYLDAARKREAGFLPSNFADQFEEVPERGFWDAAVAGAKAQAAGTVASQAEAFNIMGIGDGATANALNQVVQENARRREYTWQDMVNDPMKYIADPEGLTYDLAGGLASTAVFMGETAALGGVGGVAARATGLANKIGGTARLIQGVKTVAEANNMPWLSKIMESPAGKMLVLNVMKTPLESLSIAGSAGSAVGREGGSLEEQRSVALQAGALNTVVGAFTNTLESAGLGKLIAKEGGKDLFTKKVASVVSAAADGASKPNFVQKIRQYELNKGALANYGKSAVALTGNALLNAYEEGSQETIEQYTQGKKSDITDIINPFAWDDEALTSAAIGGVTGAGQGVVMTGVGKGLNTLFGVDEQSNTKAKEFKPTTATTKESKVVKEPLTTQPQPLTAEQQELAQAQSESYDEAFGVDEESVRDFEEKQSQKLSETVGSGVDEETAEAEYQRRNELMQLALGMDIPQFVGAKTKEQAKQSPQSPVKAKNWNRVHKGTNISIPQKELPTPTFERTPQNYVGSYTTQGIEKAINQSDNKLKELAHKIQHFDDSDRLKINVFRELRRRGITLGENFSVDADESQIIPYGSTELSTEQPQDFQKAEAPATVTQVPRERVQQAIDKYIGQPQMFKQHINDLISFVGKAVAENRISKDEAKVAVAQIKAFHDEVATAIGGTIRQYSKNTPPKSKAQNAKTSYLALPEATQKAIEESPEQAEEIFAQEAKEYIASNINTIADLSERKKEVRLQRDNAHELLRELLKPAIDVLNAGRNNGYTLVPGNQDNGRMVRMSNNDLWYQEFRKEQQHKPLVPEIEELAYQLLIDKFPYTKPDAFAIDIATEDLEEYENEMRELKQQLDYARAYYFALDEAYNNALEESKQQAKEKGDKNGKSKNQQTSEEANQSKNDGNTALESSEEKKTDGEVEEVEISNEETEKRIEQEEYNKTAQEFWVKTANYIARKYSTLADDVLSVLTGDIKNTYELLSEIGLSNQDIKKAFPVFEKLYLNRIATRHKYDDATNDYVSLYWKIVGGIIREIHQNGIDFVTVSSKINAIIDEASKEVEQLAVGNKRKKLINQKATELKKQLNPNVDEQTLVNELAEQNAYLLSEQTKSAPQQEKEAAPKETIKQKVKNAPKGDSKPKLTKTSQAVADLIKQQTDVDIAPFVDDTFKAKRGQINLYVKDMPKTAMQSLRLFIEATQKGYSPYELNVEPLGANGITLHYKERNKNQKPKVKYSAEELDKKFQAAYHGSPHIFNEFSLEHIGTGEGAQVHGWGLYFAQDKKTATQYRANLSGVDLDEVPIVIQINGITYRNEQGAWENTETGEQYEMDSPQDKVLQELAYYEGNKDKTIKSFEDKVRFSEGELKEENQKAYDFAKTIKDVSYSRDEVGKGSLFEVDVPEDDILLDENVEFSKQPEKVKKALKEIFFNKESKFLNPAMYERIKKDDWDGEVIYGMIKRAFSEQSEDDGAKSASLLLNEHGVKGITYEGGRDGRCYVIFDDEAIAIKRRYDTAIAEHKEEIQQAAEKQKAFLKDALQGGKFEIQDNGDYKVTMLNGVVIYASVKDQIIVNEAEMQNAKTAHKLSGNNISILGSWQKITSESVNGFLNISAATAKETTAYHEVTHALIDLVLTPKQKELLFNTLKPLAEQANKDIEEFVCDYVADWRLKRKNANMFGKLWQKIFDIAKRLQAWFTQTENLHNLLRKIENGEVWKQTAEMQAKEYSPANNKYFATDLAKRFQEFLHNEEDVYESEQYKKYNQARVEARNQHDVLWKEYKNLDEKLKSLTPSFDSEEAQELIKEFDIDIDSYYGRQILEMFLQNDAKSQNKELKKQIDEKWKQLNQSSYEERKNSIFAKRIVAKASRQLRKKHFFTEPPKPTNQSEFEGFTIETTGMSGYDDVLEQIDVDKKGYRYTRNSKYGLAYIAEMSPLEYMDRCALEIFKKTYHSNLYGTLVSDGDVDKYADMMKNGTKFNLPMLNYNTMQQEGRHRALAAYLNGIEKMPVLVIGQPEYNLISTKYSAEESAPKTATARVGAAWKSSKPQTFWEQVKSDGFFKALWNKFYTDWVDKLKPLEALDVINAQYLGRELKQDEKIREKAQNVSYNSAGIAHSLLDGNANDIAAVNAMLKNKKLPHEATLQMVLDEIKPSDMNDKYGKNWLKENGFDHWFEALSNYLLGRRLREMWYRRKDEFDEQVRMREEAIAQLDEETQEKIKEWDNKVLEWERNGKEGNKPKKPKDLIIAYASADGFVDVTKLPLWSEWEYALPQNISIQTVEQMIKESPKEFAKAADIYYKLNDNLLTILEDAGIISQETHEKLNEKYKEYCPLMRDFSDTAGADEFIEGLTSGGKSLANVVVPLHKIKAEGSERLVSSPLESTINAVAVFTQRAERNKVAQLAVEMTQKSGATNLLMEMPYGTKPRANESTFSVLFDGKKKVYQCEPSMYGAIAGYNIPAASMLFKVASTAANVLRVGATSSPSFILRNLIRDTMFAGISSKNGFLPIYDTIRGWNELRKNTAYATEFHAAGVDQFSFYGNGESRYKKLTEMTKEDNYGLLDPRTWLKAFREYSELAEASTRMGEYLRAREQGKEIRLAAEDARNITLNFTRSGVRGEQYNKVVPFFNAVIQGGDKMVDMFRKDFVGTSVRTFEYIILPSIVLWCLNHDEDWYKKLNPEIKNQYWCFGKNLKVPKPQEMGVLFGSGSEAILDTAYNIDPKAIDNWSKQFVGNIAPSVIPTILLPIVEWLANYNFFRNKEVVSKKLQRLPDELQYNDSTSGISKAIGSVAKISPAKIDNLVGSATGTMGMLFYSSLGLPLDGIQNVPAKHWYELPFFRDFAVTDYNLNRNVNDFYDIYNKSEKQHTGYGKKGSPSVATKTIRNAYKTISDINKDVQKIQNSRQIKPERKRLLIDRKRQQIERIAEKIVRKYGEHYL